MGPLGKVGTHDRPLEIKAQKYVSDVNSGRWTPQLPPYQPETPRTGQDKAAILDGRRHQDFPGPGLALPTSQPTPLILPHIPTPHHCSAHTSHRDPTSSLNPAQLGILSQGKPPPEFSLNASGSPSSLPPGQWLIMALLKLSLPNLLHFPSVSHTSYHFGDLAHMMPGKLLLNL